MGAELFSGNKKATIIIFGENKVIFVYCKVQVPEKAQSSLKVSLDKTTAVWRELIEGNFL